MACVPWQSVQASPAWECGLGRAPCASVWQLPQAALALKQGAGRLLRGESDYGVIVLCDPRIVSRSYGKTFLAVLEPMTSTDDIVKVARFFKRHERSGAVA